MSVEKEWTLFAKKCSCPTANVARFRTVVITNTHRHTYMHAFVHVCVCVVMFACVCACRMKVQIVVLKMKQSLWSHYTSAESSYKFAVRMFCLSLVKVIYEYSSILMELILVKFWYIPSIHNNGQIPYLRLKKKKKWVVEYKMQHNAEYLKMAESDTHMCMCMCFSYAVFFFSPLNVNLYSWEKVCCTYYY